MIFSKFEMHPQKTLSNQLVNWLYKRSQSSIPFYIFQFSFQKTPRSLNQTRCWMLKSCPSSILLLLLDYRFLWTHPQTGLVVYKDSFWVSTGPHSTPQHDSPSTRCFKSCWKSNLTSKHRQKENVTQEILKLQLGNSSSSCNLEIRSFHGQLTDSVYCWLASLHCCSKVLQLGMLTHVSPLVCSRHDKGFM